MKFALFLGALRLVMNPYDNLLHAFITSVQLGFSPLNFYLHDTEPIALALYSTDPSLSSPFENYTGDIKNSFF